MMKEEQVVYDWTKYKILVVEDEPVSRFFIEEILSVTKVKMIFSETGFEALLKFKKNPDIQLILMDIQLPDIDGYEVTREIRKIDSNIKILAQTAFAMESDRRKCLDVGCDDYITKPIVGTELLTKMAKAFSVQA